MTPGDAVDGVPALLAALGSVLLGTSAWAATLSPRARARRRDRIERDRREREVHAALYGTAEVRDASGALMTESVTGLVADVRTLKGLPILNGKGAAALTEIGELRAGLERIDRRTARFGKQLSAHIRQHDGARP